MTALIALLLLAPLQDKRKGMSSEERALSEAVKLHYVSATAEPAALKGALEKVKGVDGVSFTPNENSVTVMYSGTLPGLRGVEAAAAASGSPAYVLSHAVVNMKVSKSEKSADINVLFKEIDGLEGIRSSAQRDGGVIEIVCNLEAVTLDGLRAAAEKAKFKAEVVSHENVDVYTQGDKYAELLKQLNTVKGLVLVKIDNQTGIAKCIGVKKAAAEDAIKKAVEKSGMKLNEVKRS